MADRDGLLGRAGMVEISKYSGIGERREVELKDDGYNLARSGHKNNFSMDSYWLIVTDYWVDQEAL